MVRRRPATAVLAGVVALLLSACGGPAAPTGPGTTSAGSSAARVSPGPRRPPAGFRWTRVAASPGLAVTTVDHGAVTLLWMDPSHLRFRYVPGTKWPEGSPIAPDDTRPSTWTSHLVAAFNGAFKLSDHVGGYYYLGKVVAPLLPGYATFVVHRDGAMTVGVWGRDLRMSPDLVVVRQNMRPIVSNGVSGARPTDAINAWGLALKHLRAVNRSALGQLPDGSLVFELGHLVTPETVAGYLVRAGVREAMMLDMNVVWPTGYLYTRSGGRAHGVRINRFIKRPPSIYLSQFEKDFVAVESR